MPVGKNAQLAENYRFGVHLCKTSKVSDYEDLKCAIFSVLNSYNSEINAQVGGRPVFSMAMSLSVCMHIILYIFQEAVSVTYIYIFLYIYLYIYIGI